MEPTLPYSETTELTGLWQEIKKILEYLISPQLQGSILPLKIAFIFISIVFCVIIIYFLIKTDFIQWWFLKALRDFLFPKPIRKQFITRKWKKIKKKFEKSKFESQWKVCLIENLNVFDESLKEMGYPGENLREKLDKLTREDIPNLDDLFRAYRICQDIIRDPDYRLGREEAQVIIETFEKALKDLELL